MEVKIPIKKPHVIDTLPNSLSAAEEQLNMLLKDKFFGFSNFIDLVFWWCVDILHVWGDITGVNYKLIYILIFVVVHPALIFKFFKLWIVEPE